MAVPQTILTQMLEVAGVALFAVAALQDLAFRLVPNRVPLAIAGLGLACRCATGSLLVGCVSFAVVFSVAAACWRRGWLGGADVKLFGAGALLAPSGAAAGFVLCTCLAGGVLAIGYWLAGRVVPAACPPARPTGPLRRLARVEARRIRRGGPLPYAVALLAGASAMLAGG